MRGFGGQRTGSAECEHLAIRGTFRAAGRSSPMAGIDQVAGTAAPWRNGDAGRTAAVARAVLESAGPPRQNKAGRAAAASPKWVARASLKMRMRGLPEV